MRLRGGVSGRGSGLQNKTSQRLLTITSPADSFPPSTGFAPASRARGEGPDPLSTRRCAAPQVSRRTPAAPERDTSGRPWRSSTSIPTANTRSSTAPTGSPMRWSTTSRKLGMDSLAVTDHGNLHAAWSFYEAAKAAKIRPILGFEAYLAFGSAPAREKPAGAPGALQPPRPAGPEPRRLPEPRPADARSGSPRASTAARGSTRRCSEQHSEGIVCLAACLSGEVALYLRQGNYEEAQRSAEWFAELFGPDGFWLEIQKHGIPEETLVTEGMLRLGQELGLGVVATNDAHYLRREDAEAHDVLLAIGTGADLDDPKRFRFTGQESYVKSRSGDARALPRPPGGARQHASGWPTSASSTSRSATSCPSFPRPRGVRHRRGAAGPSRARRGRRALRHPAARRRSQERLDYELGVINTRRLRRLLPDRRRTSSRAARERGHPGRAGPRLRGRLAGGLRAPASPTSTRSGSTCCSSGS